MSVDGTVSFGTCGAIVPGNSSTANGTVVCPDDDMDGAVENCFGGGCGLACCDNCPNVPNPTQKDLDGDGIGDACESGCGNDVINGTEMCDGPDLAGETCLSQSPFDSGDLACSRFCDAFDTACCFDAMCGNDMIEGGEVCDGTDLGGETCQSQGFDTGTLACKQNCNSFNTSGCFNFPCGNGVREGSEVCDGMDLGGETCESQGFDGGMLACNPDCQGFDTSGCFNFVCDNDGVCESLEDCNGCSNDCISGTAPGQAVCGNGECEAGDGENCVNCPDDCNGKQSGKPENRFCCGDGGGVNPVTCADSRCTSGSFMCTDVPVPPINYCCGDGTCEGAEDTNNCGVDCDICVPTHSNEKGPRCSDGIDNDCDGLIDGADPDC